MRIDGQMDLTAALAPEPQPGRNLFEVAWAVIFPPVLAALAVWFTGAWSAGDNFTADMFQVLPPLVLGGMTVLAAVIYFDCRANEKLGVAASDVRLALHVSVFLTLLFLAAWVTAQAEREHVPEATALVLFLCLPVLLVCGPLLWFSIRAIKSTARRLLILATFLATTALVELQSQNSDYRNAEERVFMLHSLLIALALAIRLVTWSAEEFRRH